MKKYDFKGASAYHKEWSTYVFDIIGRPLSVFFTKYTPITPNQISIISFVLAIFGGIFFLKAGHTNLVIGAWFAFFYNVFDMIDGRIARAKKLSSKLGKWLDGMIDFIVFPYLIFTLALGLKTYTAAVVGMLAIVSYQTHYLIVHFFKSEILQQKKPIRIPGRLEFLRHAYGSNFFYLFLLVAIIVKMPMLVLWFWAIFGNLYWLLVILVQFMQIRKLRS